MRFRGTAREAAEQKNSNMTAMIDIVFLLLVFFVMTFRVTALEGDFTIHPPAAPSRVAAQPIPLDEIHIRLSADGHGELSEVQWNGQTLADWDQLEARLAEIAGWTDQPSNAVPLPVVLRTDQTLRYEHTMAAITSVERISRQSASGQPRFELRLAS